jgi:replicative DNA helicase
LDDLKGIVMNDAEFAFAITSLRKSYISRYMAETLQRATEILHKKGGDSAFNILDKRLYDLKLNTLDTNYMSLTDLRKVDDLIDYLQDMRDHPEKYKGIPSGWHVLDSLTAGFQKQEYVLIMAKSGSGKSMAMLNWANHAQKLGYNVVYVSLEMPEKVIRMRLLSLESSIPFLNIKTQNLTAEQLQRQEATLRNEVATRTGAFYVMDVPRCTVGLIEAQLRQLSQTMPIDIVFIDYLALLKPEVHIRNSSGLETVYAISNDLHDLARTMKITVVSANQITTEGMKKKSSDDLEIEDAAISRRAVDPVDILVGLIWNKANPNEMGISIPKCRGGRIQSAKLFCNLDVCKITNITEGNDPNLNTTSESIKPPDEKEFEDLSDVE